MLLKSCTKLDRLITLTPIPTAGFVLKLFVLLINPVCCTKFGYQYEEYVEIENLVTGIPS